MRNILFCQRFGGALHPGRVLVDVFRTERSAIESVQIHVCRLRTAKHHPAPATYPHAYAWVSRLQPVTAAGRTMAKQRLELRLELGLHNSSVRPSWRSSYAYSHDGRLVFTHP